MSDAQTGLEHAIALAAHMQEEAKAFEEMLRAAKQELAAARKEIDRLKDLSSQLRRRSPTQEEADEAERRSSVRGRCLVEAGYWRGTRCPGCRVWVWRGLDWCDVCEARHEMQEEM